MTKFLKLHLSCFCFYYRRNKIENQTRNQKLVQCGPLNIKCRANCRNLLQTVPCGVLWQIKSGCDAWLSIQLRDLVYNHLTHRRRRYGRLVPSININFSIVGCRAASSEATLLAVLSVRSRGTTLAAPVICQSIVDVPPASTALSATRAPRLVCRRMSLYSDRTERRRKKQS